MCCVALQNITLLFNSPCDGSISQSVQLSVGCMQVRVL